MGRAEIITPTAEQAFEEQLTHFVGGDEAARAMALQRAGKSVLAASLNRRCAASLLAENAAASSSANRGSSSKR